MSFYFKEKINFNIKIFTSKLSLKNRYKIQILVFVLDAKIASLDFMEVQRLEQKMTAKDVHVL